MLFIEKNFDLTWKRELRPRGTDKCFDVSRHEPGAVIMMYTCHSMHGNQEFIYKPVSEMIW
jgi:polypeptide N-acetylgalactosaminyltransferase